MGRQCKKEQVVVIDRDHEDSFWMKSSEWELYSQLVLYATELGYFPTITELAEILDSRSTSTIHTQILDLKHCGLVRSAGSDREDQYYLTGYHLAPVPGARTQADLMADSQVSLAAKMIYLYSYSYLQSNGVFPTTRQICAGVALSSPSTVYEHLKQLEKKGYVVNVSPSTTGTRKKTRYRLKGYVFEKNSDFRCYRT